MKTSVIQGVGGWRRIVWWWARVWWAATAPAHSDWMAEKWWEDRATGGPELPAEVLEVVRDGGTYRI